MTTPASNFDLSGLIDLHIHAAPDVAPRYADDLGLVREATEAGMRAVLLKSHVTITADRATIAEKVVGGARAFGGLVLNDTVGGFNPAAVEAAIKLGAAQIWMPTLSAAGHYRSMGKPGGLRPFDDQGRLLPAVAKILEMVREAGIVLGTGHLLAEDVVDLAKTARERGLRKILVTHPEARFAPLSVEAQLEISGEGVFFERCYLHALPASQAVTVPDIAAQIRKVGVESTVLATDFGQVDNPAPVQGLRAYLATLRDLDFTEGELRRMAGENPAHLLGL